MPELYDRKATLYRLFGAATHDQPPVGGSPDDDLRERLRAELVRLHGQTSDPPVAGGVADVGGGGAGNPAWRQARAVLFSDQAVTVDGDGYLRVGWASERGGTLEVCSVDFIRRRRSCWPKHAR